MRVDDRGADAAQDRPDRLRPGRTLARSGRRPQRGGRLVRNLSHAGLATVPEMVSVNRRMARRTRWFVMNATSRISRIRSGAPNRKSTNPASALLPVASKIRRQAQLGEAPQASISSGDGLTWRSTR